MAPALIALAVGLGWSAFWLMASQRAQAQLDTFLAKEAADGRVITCSDRRVGGYPFRLELRCAIRASR